MGNGRPETDEVDGVGHVASTSHLTLTDTAVVDAKLVARLGRAAYLGRLVYNAAADRRVPFAEGLAYRLRLGQARRTGAAPPSEPASQARGGARGGHARGLRRQAAERDVDRRGCPPATRAWCPWASGPETQAGQGIGAERQEPGRRAGFKLTHHYRWTVASGVGHALAYAAARVVTEKAWSAGERAYGAASGTTRWHIRPRIVFDLLKVVGRSRSPV